MRTTPTSINGVAPGSSPGSTPDSTPNSTLPLAQPTGYAEWSAQLQARINDPDNIQGNGQGNEPVKVQGNDQNNGPARPAANAWYAVIDPSVDDELPGLLWKLHNDNNANRGGGDKGPEIWPLLMNTMLQEVSLRGPLFVPLKPHGSSTRWFFENSQYKAVGVLYETEATQASALFEHLQNLLECTMPSGKPGLFRFHDPRVLYALTGFADKTWQRHALGPAKTLHAWEPGRQTPLVVSGLRHGQAQKHYQTHYQTHYQAHYQALETEGIQLSQELLDHIGACTVPYAIINSLQGETGERLRAMPLPEAFAFVNGVCASLHKMNIVTTHDLAFGTSIALQVRCNIFEHFFVQERILKRKPDESLPDVIKNLPDEYIEDVMHEE